MSDKSIDIKKPGFNWKKKGSIAIKKPGLNWKKEGLIWLGFLVLVAAVVGYLVYAKKNKSVVEKKNTRVMTASTIPNDFWGKNEPVKPKPTQRPEPEHKIERTPTQTPVKINVEHQPVKTNVVVSPTPQNLFNLHNPDLKIKKVQTLNNRRRGVVEISVKNIKTKSQKSDIKKVVGKWNEPKTQASLPIDMSRVLTMDRFISAILVPEIDSELSGKVTAQVEQNVYGAHGRKILVPAGTKAIGRYESLKKVGEERLSIRWMRLITPDGINIHCGDAEMVDSMGRVGITGDVDRKYFERYGMSLLVSAITAISTYSVPVRNENQQVVVESFGKEQSSLAKTILEDNLEIKPKITIPYGSRVMISPSKDIWFKKLKNNEIMILPLEG